MKRGGRWQPLSKIRNATRCSSPTLDRPRRADSLIRIAIGKPRVSSSSRQGAARPRRTLQAWRADQASVTTSPSSPFFTVPGLPACLVGGSAYPWGVPQSVPVHAPGLLRLPLTGLDRCVAASSGRSTRAPSGGGGHRGVPRGGKRTVANDMPAPAITVAQMHVERGLCLVAMAPRARHPLSKRPSPRSRPGACPQGQALAGLHGQIMHRPAMQRPGRRASVAHHWGGSTRRTSAMGAGAGHAVSGPIAASRGGGQDGHRGSRALEQGQGQLQGRATGLHRGPGHPRPPPPERSHRQRTRHTQEGSASGQRVRLLSASAPSARRSTLSLESVAGVARQRIAGYPAQIARGRTVAPHQASVRTAGPA